MGSGRIRQDNSAFRWVAPLRDHAGPLALAAGMWAGAGVFFAVPAELPWSGAATALLGAGGALFWLGVWQRRAALLLLGAGLALLLVQAQISRLGRDLNWEALARPVWVKGELADRYPAARNPNREWLVLRRAVVYQPGHILQGKEVRVTVDAARAAALSVGEGVTAQVLLWPPEGPQEPGAKDFRLWRYLHEDTLRGYVRGEMEPAVLPAAEATATQRVQGWFEGWRKRITQGLNGAGDGVVAALLVGERKGIPATVEDDYRRSGLTHLLAISGFQLTVVGGGIFFLVQWLMALWPWLALHVDTRRVAAITALAAATCYTLLAGAEVSVVRALVMLAILFAAVIGGRLRSLVRAWAVAVILILAVDPSMVTNAGFQLSFVAVLALILWAAAEPAWHGTAGKLKALTMSSVVAGVATLPVVALNFGQVSLVGVVANLVAVPAMGLLTGIGMGVLAAWPLGLAGPLVPVMDAGTRLVNLWAAWMATWPGASLDIPAWSGWLLAPVCLLLLGLVVCRQWRASAGVGVVLVLAVVGLANLRAAYTCTVTHGGRETDCPADIVSQRDEASPEDCALLERVIVPEDGASACTDRTLTEHRFGWAGRHADGTWDVFVPATRRVWEHMPQP